MVAALTEDMKRIIDEQRLGFVATVDLDGTPNVSPKATFAVIDERSIGYCDIRSPRTMSNINRGSILEVNFVDPFVRKGYRFKGKAEIVPRGDARFDSLARHFLKYGSIVERARSIVIVHVDRALPLVSPAYDDERSDETEIRRAWLGSYPLIDLCSVIAQSSVRLRSQGTTPSLELMDSAKPPRAKIGLNNKPAIRKHYGRAL
jgi:predicted pyridoxine 5'-phosphate oxidase superfamily flavin-nucleotide-binding protein